jgi:hypothetical protein
MMIVYTIKGNVGRAMLCFRERDRGDASSLLGMVVAAFFPNKMFRMACE